MKLIGSLLFIFTVFVIQYKATSQTVIHTEDFESATGWSFVSSGVNNWTIEKCSGNGTSLPGLNALYVTNSAPDGGCSSSGNELFAYDNAFSGTEEIIAFTMVDGSCATNYILAFDYRVEGIIGEDYVDVVYSLDGVNFFPAGIALTQSSTWTSGFTPLPALLDNSIFYIGFRYTYNDANGGTLPAAIDNIAIVGDDTVPPTISCPNDTNVYVDINCNGIIEDYTGDAIVSDNCSPIANISVTQLPLPGLVVNGALVETSIELTATDEAGNEVKCSFFARAIDTIPATIQCPSDTIVYATNNCDGALADYTGAAVAADNCNPSSSLTITQDPIPTTIISADQIITLTVDGGIPNIPQSCTFTAFFIDTVAPGIICPAPIDIYANSSCEAILPDYGTLAVYIENCDPSPTITQSPIAGTTISGTNNSTVTLNILDASGNSSSCQLTQQVIDTIKPVVTCPGIQTANSDASCQTSIGDYTGLVTSTDNCSSLISISQSPLPATTVSSNTTITMTATDEAGNSQTCNFSLELIDVIAPVIACPSNTNVSPGVGCTYILADFTSGTTATDNCSSALNMTYSQDPIPGTSLNSGAHTITLYAEDENSNIGSCTFSLTVSDQTPPAISSCGSNLTVYSDVNCEALAPDFTTGVVTSDNCSSLSVLSITQNVSAGSVLTTSTTVTITVQDEAGNQSTCNVTAIVADTINPTLTCPANQDVSINSSCQYTVPDLVPLVSGTDNCSALANMNITQNPPAGSTQNGITSVLIQLTDEGGNSASCTLILTPIDTEPPSITCPTPAVVNNGVNCDYTLPYYGTTSTVLDNCSGYIINQLPAAGTVIQPGITTIELEVIDAGGNSDVCSFDLQVIETENPLITCPTNISTCDPNVTYSDPVYSDNCAVSLTQTEASGLGSGSVFPIGITTIEYTAMDSTGNSATCQFTVEVLDYPGAANIIDDTLWLCAQNSTVISADLVSSGTGEWTVISGQGAFNNQFANSTGLNNIGIGTNVYAWNVSTTSCGFNADTLVVINSQQDIQASTQDTIYACDQNEVVLLGNAPLYGIGTWTTTGSGTISTPNSPSTSSSFDNGWQLFIWTISNGSCPSSSDTLHVFGLKKPEIQTADTLVCIENDLIQIEASGLSNDQYGYWYVANGSATIDDPFSSMTSVHNFGYGSTWITYTLTNPYCPSRSDTLIVVANLCNDYDPVIPTVFTPGNLDGSNDLFKIPFLGVLYPECKVLIFNRWGSVVYESVGYDEPWDGRFKGEILPMGTYFYQIDLNDGSGKQFKGDISIIK